MTNPYHPNDSWGLEGPLFYCYNKGLEKTFSALLYFRTNFRTNLMGTSSAVVPSEISVLDYAIQRLDQKDFRFRLKAALAELDLDTRTTKALNSALNRWGLL